MKHVMSSSVVVVVVVLAVVAAVVAEPSYPKTTNLLPQDPVRHPLPDAVPAGASVHNCLQTADRPHPLPTKPSTKLYSLVTKYSDPIRSRIRHSDRLQDRGPVCNSGQDPIPDLIPNTTVYKTQYTPKYVTTTQGMCTRPSTRPQSGPSVRDLSSKTQQTYKTVRPKPSYGH
ncbi:hypothetical protein Hamer_G024882 [Homarus americanus]|uniref:Secreted protein n=1 Tax=Homarus americanus TaxID=6706 RepID=A0A8J5JPI8_HOMAM|nr:hypothetical protein Hamer_G024882 [Homarus americanus]